MRLTVFGASGRTGVPLVERALERGHEVVAFVRDAGTLDVHHDRLRIVEGERVSLTGRVIGGLLKLLSPEVLEDAENHATAVRESGLDWTVVRVPRLSEAPPRGEYRTGDVAPGRKPIARADVADFLLDVVESDRYVRELPKITY